jgi:hypothetical protein
MFILHTYLSFWFLTVSFLQFLVTTLVFVSSSQALQVMSSECVVWPFLFSCTLCLSIPPQYFYFTCVQCFALLMLIFCLILHPYFACSLINISKNYSFLLLISDGHVDYWQVKVIQISL